MSPKNNGAIYKDKIEILVPQIKRLKQKHMLLGLLKLLWAGVGILAFLRAFTGDQSIAMTIFGACALLFLITWWCHEYILQKKKSLKSMLAINENELRCLCHDFTKRSDDGHEFIDPDHTYAADLDLFGEKSFFHHINRCYTAVGRQCLANWLKKPAAPPEIKLRQEAVTELADKLDFRQKIMAHNFANKDNCSKLKFFFFFMEEPFFFQKHSLLRFFIYIYIWPVITIFAAVSIFFQMPVSVFITLFLSQLVINKSFEKVVAHIHVLIAMSCKILKGYANILETIEKEQFSSEKLNELKGRLLKRDKKASHYVRKIAMLLDWFDTRNSVLHFIVNNTLFWDLHCLYAIEKWRKNAAAYAHEWFDVIGEVEALSSLACLKYNNPHWVMPEVLTGTFQLTAVGLGHPLIPARKRVYTDISMGGKDNGNMVIVTGPHMSGKSTLLRTVGINMVCAYAGAPVCAQKFTVTATKIFTAMHANDSLEKQQSLFYAELKRIKALLEKVSRKEPVFFLIDEMLKGTNATDRYNGTTALLKQLMRNHANGITTTHEVELTKVGSPDEWEKNGEKIPSGYNLTNYHFDVDIQDEKLVFDYILKQGICENFNSLVLMRKMGIDI